MQGEVAQELSAVGEDPVEQVVDEDQDGCVSVSTTAGWPCTDIN